MASPETDVITPAVELQVQPPPSNRGVTKVGVYASVDWLRYTVPWSPPWVPSEWPQIEGQLRCAVHPSPVIELTGEVLGSSKGYNTGMKMNYGTVRYHTELASQKICVEFTGSDLEELRRIGVPAWDLIAHCRTVGGKVTRGDLAIDIFGFDADPLDVLRAWEKGEAITRVKEVTPYERKTKVDGKVVSGGATVYVGAWGSSDRYMRVYDKAKQQKVDGKWTRIELQMGGDLAAEVIPMITGENVTMVVQAAVRGFCQCPTVGWYTMAVDGPVCVMPKVKRRPSRRKKWLLFDVLPSLQEELKLCAEVSDWELYYKFMAAMYPYHAKAGH